MFKTWNGRAFRAVCCGLLSLFLAQGAAIAQAAPDFSTLCSTTTIAADTNRKSLCEAAAAGFLNGMIQNQSVAQQSQTLALQNLTQSAAIAQQSATISLQTQAQLLANLSQSALTSKTAADIKAFSDLRNALQPNSATLAAISPDTVVLPDMRATAQAEAVKAASLQAKAAAAALRAEAFRCSAGTQPTILLNAAELPASVRSYKSALAALQLMNDHAKTVLEEVKAIPRPSPLAALGNRPLPNLQINKDAPLTGDNQLKSLSVTALLSGATLLLDFASNAAALAASFRPVVSSTSATMTQAALEGSHSAYAEALIEKGWHLKDVSEVLPLGMGASKIRGASSALMNTVDELRRETYTIAAYSYPKSNPQVTPTAPQATASAAPVTPTVSAEQTRRDKAASDAQAIVLAAQGLQKAIFTDTVPNPSATATISALINSFDVVESLGLLEGKDECFATLKFAPQEIHYDRHAKQRAFGSPQFSARVFGHTRAQITRVDGRIVSNQNVLVDTGWIAFGP